MTIENTPATDAYEAHIRKHERWNFTVNLLDLTFYNLATSFVFGSTVLSLYASYLTSSAALIGLIPAIQSVGNFLPQLLTARYSEQLERKLPFVQKVSVMERVPYLFVFLGIVLIPDAPRWLAYAILALSLAMATGSGGLGAPAWNAMLAKVVPVRRRGLMFGLSSAAGGLLGVAGAALSRHVLATYPYPTSFGICFALCFAFQVVSWICLSMNREPAKKPNIEAVSITTYWKRLPDVLREHPNFARWLVAHSLTILGTMGTAFYVVYARKTFNVDDSFAATLTMAALASQTVSTPLLGWLADRLGHKWLSEVCALVGAAGALLILVAPGVIWLYGVFMLVNISVAGRFISETGITMEFCDPDDVPTISALANTISAAPILLAPVLGGWIADLAGYRVLFAVALALFIAGWSFMHWGVREPRHEAVYSRASVSDSGGDMRGDSTAPRFAQD
jgi:MFS family permease